MLKYFKVQDVQVSKLYHVTSPWRATKSAAPNGEMASSPLSGINYYLFFCLISKDAQLHNVIIGIVKIFSLHKQRKRLSQWLF